MPIDARKGKSSVQHHQQVRISRIQEHSCDLGNLSATRCLHAKLQSHQSRDRPCLAVQPWKDPCQPAQPLGKTDLWEIPGDDRASSPKRHGLI